jgi:predicted RecB family nuclease
MATSKKNLRTCSQGHQYYKSSDCPTCPICEQERKPESGFLSLLIAPARRALEREGITTIEQLAKYSEADILELHGMGPSTMPKLRSALKAKGLTFRKGKSK